MRRAEELDAKEAEKAAGNWLQNLAALAEELAPAHPRVLSYTPREIVAWGELLRRRRAAEDRTAFYCSLVAARGDGAAVSELIASLRYGNDSPHN